MEKVTKELDGYYRTPSGFCAVIPRMASGRTPDGMSFFEFRTDAFADIIRVEWPTDAPVALFDSTTATAMIRLNYGLNLSDAQAEEFNELVDVATAGEQPAAAPAKKGRVSASTAAAATAPAATMPTASEPPPPPSEQLFPPEGWLVHPDSAGYFYKDQEVLTEDDLRARYAISSA